MLGMIKNYFSIAWRNIIRNKTFTLSNIVGLSLGITSAILIFTVVTYHFSFDNFHQDPDRIYRIVSEFRAETTEYQPGVPEPLGKAFRNDFSFGAATARIFSLSDVTISLPGDKDEKRFREENKAAFAEPSFFDIFNFPLVNGARATGLLTAPNTVLLTEEMAKKYFGTEDAVGRIIRLNLRDHVADFAVSGILRDVPANTDLRHQLYFSYDNLKDYDARYATDSSWGSVSSSMNCFVRLQPGVTRASVEKALPSLVKKYYSETDAKETW